MGALEICQNYFASIFSLFTTTESWWRSTDAAIFSGSSSHDTLMDSSFNTVIHFQIQLRKLVLLVSGCFLNISQRRSVNDVSNNETRNSFILWNGLSSRDASLDWRGCRKVRNAPKFQTIKKSSKATYLTRLTCPRPFLLRP